MKEETYLGMSPESKSDPIIPAPLPLLFNSRHIPLLLKHLGILGHIGLILKAVKVAHVSLAIQHRHKGRVALAERVEGERLEEGKGLAVREGGNTVFGVCDETCMSASVDYSEWKQAKGWVYRLGEIAHLVTASQATSDKLKIKSSGRSYTGRRSTLGQFLRFAQVSLGVWPENGGKPCHISHKFCTPVSKIWILPLSYGPMLSGGTHTEEFKQDTTQRPVIGRVSVCLAAQDFRGHAIM